MATNVVTPPRTSRPTVVPRPVSSKKRSSTRHPPSHDQGGWRIATRRVRRSRLLVAPVTHEPHELLQPDRPVAVAVGRLDERLDLALGRALPAQRLVGPAD